ncbi:RNA polymerase II transcription factor B subunit 4 [Babesia sp. Xinjiang]|uniref:RNA polymerase II transcription factor B subunit 4 n=1 Tax=Babesia sp. Xinjiang TaxID=462227 RepID=UPI000A263946|nr:RNA polymerase II transcription factor B subunit 4 [Babesia sp. Xinjiang]ORM39950.1 RNA polymerase II transcription factor B subunit 4 [Babesia sp. Xinjiang]
MKEPREGNSASVASRFSTKVLTDSGDSVCRTENALVIVLDLTPSAWTGATAPSDLKLQLPGFFRLVYRFLKTYAFMSANHRCCVIGTHNSGARILYEGEPSSDWLPSCFGNAKDQNARSDATILKFWNAMLEFIGTCIPSSKDPLLTTALSMGLLYLNRLRVTGAGFGRRIIFLDVSATNEYRSQYIGLMNVAFTASKSSISINTCAFRRSSRILEQLSDVTNAKYLNLSKVLQSVEDNESREQSVLQLLMFWFLPSEGVSEQLSTQLPFDFSNTAVCYCHYRTVDIAFLCPCCFAVHCSEKDDKGRYRIFCLVCNSRLSRPLVKRKSAGDADFSKT